MAGKINLKIGAITIGKSLSKNTSIKGINLSETNITNDGLIEFLNYLIENNTLSMLDLSNNHFDDKAGPSIVDFIAVCFSYFIFYFIFFLFFFYFFFCFFLFFCFFFFYFYINY